MEDLDSKLPSPPPTPTGLNDENSSRASGFPILTESSKVTSVAKKNGELLEMPGLKVVPQRFLG